MNEPASPELAPPPDAPGAAPPEAVSPPAPAGTPPPAPSRRPLLQRIGTRLVSFGAWLRRYFREQDPTFWIAFTPALIVAAILFVRSPTSNYIFDEQEALLANPYVNGHGLRFLDAFRRDFWGLPPGRSIGSYRPIPDMIWRVLWHISQAPWLHHWVNVVFHAVNAALIAGIVLRITRRRGISWLAGASFLMSAVLTEAITGVVGIADVLGGLGVILCVLALELPLFAMPFAVFAAMLFGMLCKESALVAVPLVAWFALVASPALHPERPRRVLRALFALVATTGGLVAYTYFRRHFFPVRLPASLEHPLPASAPLAERAMHAFMAWFQQPSLPRDPINNPLVKADFPHRVAGALRVYWRGLGQVFFPLHLSGDYSYPQEPIPPRLLFPGSVVGALFMIAPPLAGVGMWVRALVIERRERRAASGLANRDSPSLSNAMLLAIGLVWAPVAYFPHSNIPVLLPTVRAERFWYLPVMGTALVIAVFLTWLYHRVRWKGGAVAVALAVAFFGFQSVRARMHALDYTDDLTFWRATREAVPNSAKAHLNYSVMLGARGHLHQRLRISKHALDLAPSWPMAHIYYADTLCRLHRPDEAWPEYRRGFEMAANDPNLIALGLQCLWDEKDFKKHEAALQQIAAKHPGSWLSYLVNDVAYNGKKNHGVAPKYRPRGYDEGPKKH